MSLNPTAGDAHPPNPAHPIESLMKTAMDAISGMIDVNTVVGTPVETGDGTTIIPISRVSFGFLAGGGEYTALSGPGRPFGGGSGAGVSVRPVGFLVEHAGSVRLLAVDGGDLATRLVDLAPDVVRWIQERFGRSDPSGSSPPA
jgi:sporulation protein YtfJ